MGRRVLLRTFFELKDIIVTDRFVINSIGFTGPGKNVDLAFGDGLNVLWGASNTGKSYVVKALDFMFGAKSSSLPAISQRAGYATAWLNISLPKSGTVTLRRGLTGGDFELFNRDVEFGSQDTDFSGLSIKHGEDNSLSSFLLNEMGISNKKIAQNKNASKKAGFSFRLFAPYLLTEETAMISEHSPIRMSYHNEGRSQI